MALTRVELDRIMSKLEAASTGAKQRKTLLQNLVEHYETLVRNTEAEVDSIAHVLEARSTKLTEEVERLTQEIADLKEQKACMSSSRSFIINRFLHIYYRHTSHHRNRSLADC